MFLLTLSFTTLFAGSTASPLPQNSYYFQNSRQFYPPIPQRYGYQYQQFPHHFQFQHRPQQYYPQRYQPFQYSRYPSQQQYIPEIGLEEAYNAIPIFAEVVYMDELGEVCRMET